MVTMVHEKIQKAFTTAAETMRLIGYNPDDIVDTAFEYLALFCTQYSVKDPVGRLSRALERLRRAPKPG